MWRWRLWIQTIYSRKNNVYSIRNVSELIAASYKGISAWKLKGILLGREIAAMDRRQPDMNHWGWKTTSPKQDAFLDPIQYFSQFSLQLFNVCLFSKCFICRPTVVAAISLPKKIPAYSMLTDKIEYSYTCYFYQKHSSIGALEQGWACWRRLLYHFIIVHTS